MVEAAVTDVPVTVDTNRAKFKPLSTDKKMNNENLQQNGDGSSNPDTDNNNINNYQPTNNNSDPLDKVASSQTSQPKKPISEARLRANRQNSKKSTGPKTDRGKGYSRRNAVKHGLLLKRLLFSDDGEPINQELHDLYDSLHERYGKGDIRTHLLVEGLVVEYWRQRMALNIEVDCLKKASFHFSPHGNMPNVLRYRTASQRAFLKSLDQLDQLPPPPSEAEEAEDPTQPPEDSLPALEPNTSGLAGVAAEQCPPECGSQSENEAASGGA